MIEKSISLPKESSELAEFLASLIKVVIEQSKDGVQVTDAAPLIAKLFEGFQGEAFKGLDKLGEEIKKEPFKFACVLALAIEEILKK